MKKYVAAILAAALCLSLLSACGGKNKDKDRLARIQEAGEITIAMEGTWAPWTYHDDSGELVGFDTEVGQAIADKLGVKANFVEGGWDGLLAGLESGRYDIMVNGVNITEDREAVYDFSDPYAYDRMAVIVRADDDRIHAMEDLAGMETANTITSVYAAKAKEYGANVTGVDDLAQTFQLLLTDRIDATLNSHLTYLDYMDANPDAQLKVALLAADADLIAIPMQKGDDTATLRAAINKAIGELAADGTLSKLSEKYFGTDITKAE